MRIHVEWCDKTGKTTLIKYLQDNLWWEVVKFSQPKTKNPFQEYKDFLLESQGKNLILDRSWLWENVYWPIYRNKWLTPEHFEILDDICESNNDLFIITHQDVETVSKNFVIDWETFTKDEHIKPIIDQFIEEWSKLNTTKMLYNYKLQNLDSILDLVTSWYKDRVI